MRQSVTCGELGSRWNEGKRKWSLLPYDAIAEIIKVLEFGANKYGKYNWQKGLTFSETFESLQRHILAWYSGEDKDAETGLSHLAHAGCNILFLLWFTINGRGVDDRLTIEYRARKEQEKLDHQLQQIDDQLRRAAYALYPDTDTLKGGSCTIGTQGRG